MCQNRSSWHFYCQSASKLSAASTLFFFTIHCTYHSDYEIKLHYEGGIFIHKLYYFLKIFTNEASHKESSFKSGGPEIARKSVIVEINEKHCAHAASCTAWGEESCNIQFSTNNWQHLSPVSSFLTDSTPLITCIGRKHSALRIQDVDFECGSPLAVILNFLSNLWLSQQQQTLFEFRSVILDQCNTSKHWLYSAALFRVVNFESGWRLDLWEKSSYVNSLM